MLLINIYTATSVFTSIYKVLAELLAANRRQTTHLPHGLSQLKAKQNGPIFTSYISEMDPFCFTFNQLSTQGKCTQLKTETFHFTFSVVWSASGRLQVTQPVLYRL